ncbi:DUF1015 domain-containing protein [Ruminococcus difficilis]|uniref:DUF1015 domain-containing protein n=1 Tax=Ruminococcus difficilis TaxID=2763069 RepID=A0A934WT88_9FIRM|nr:DUF1015 domain-containing protein [Ruminococcus difficilis]MBK6089531.1 DUF1015 domain-containing protein [Ruminococcus difficilis]
MKHFNPADILLPKKDFENWAVVACDQYTSEPEYWHAVEEKVGDKPSTLHLILPEIYLSNDNSERVNAINAEMQRYLDGDVFDLHENSMIYVERESNNAIRRGIVGLIDLEDYDYRRGATSAIRATEATVLERIPPRVQIRKDAPLELPHILLLIDDPDRTVIEPLTDEKGGFKEAYNFDLMQNGGHIDGYFLSDEAISRVQDALEALIADKDDKLLFAVGDGNHSLATAKECYNLSQNPLARYALVEVVNIHDESIEFEPIYRVLFNVDSEDFIEKFSAYTDAKGGMRKQTFRFINPEVDGELEVKATAKLPVGTLQSYIDLYMQEHPEVRIDYIHGEEVVENLCKQEGTLGFIFEGMQKDELFPAITADGSLPRKTFSMGHAHDKRYYIEARKIK